MLKKPDEVSGEDLGAPPAHHFGYDLGYMMMSYSYPVNKHPHQDHALDLNVSKNLTFLSTTYFATMMVTDIVWYVVIAT